MEKEGFLKVFGIEFASPAPRAKEGERFPEGTVEASFRVAGGGIGGEDAVLHLFGEGACDGGGDLADVFITGVAPLPFLPGECAAELVKACVKVVAKVQALELSVITGFQRQAVLEEILVGAAAIGLQTCHGAYVAPAGLEEGAGELLRQGVGGIAVGEGAKLFRKDALPVGTCHRPAGECEPGGGAFRQAFLEKAGKEREGFLGVGKEAVVGILQRGSVSGGAF